MEKRRIPRIQPPRLSALFLQQNFFQMSQFLPDMLCMYPSPDQHLYEILMKDPA